MGLIRLTPSISGASQPPRTLELQLTQTAGSHPLRGLVICSLRKHDRGSVEEVHQWYVNGDYRWQQHENQSRHRRRQKPYPRRLALCPAHPYINAVTQGQKSKRREKNGSRGHAEACEGWKESLSGRDRSQPRDRRL